MTGPSSRFPVTCRRDGGSPAETGPDYLLPAGQETCAKYGDTSAKHGRTPPFPGHLKRDPL
jgi:hypothetical protein